MDNTIVILNNDGQMVVTSREIAANFKREHGKVIRSIEKTMENQPSQKWIGYFIPSEYADAKMEMRKEYLLTRDGVTLLVMGFTGQKALEWKIKYINAFNSMEVVLKNSKNGKQKTSNLQPAVLGELIETTADIEQRVVKLENTMTIDYGQQRTLSELAKHKAIAAVGGKSTTAYKNKNLRGRIFSAVWRDYKEYFQINSYKDTYSKDFVRAKEYLKVWRAQGKIQREIEDCNDNKLMQ